MFSLQFFILPCRKKYGKISFLKVEKSN